ncbi:unnamed protein product [Amoebophrya sp. A120]|nr:unnamed protein product [Amoebophrya sp. A120]|eukprot:GSA120T00015107001.1
MQAGRGRARRSRPRRSFSLSHGSAIFFGAPRNFLRPSAGKSQFLAELESCDLAEPPGGFKENPPLAPLSAADCVRTPQLRHLFQESLISQPRTVVDFTYFGAASRDALEIRMQELKDQVDLFVIVEADVDHRGMQVRNDIWPEVLSKQAAFREFSDRVLHLPLHYTGSRLNGTDNATQLDSAPVSFAIEAWMAQEGSRQLHTKLQKRFFSSPVRENSEGSALQDASEETKSDSERETVQKLQFVSNNTRTLLPPQQPTVDSRALLVLTAHTDETPSREVVQLVRNCKFRGEKLEEHFPLHTASLMVQNLVDQAFRTDFPANPAFPYEYSQPTFALFHPAKIEDAGGATETPTAPSGPSERKAELDTFGRVANVPPEKTIYGGAHMTGYPFPAAFFLKMLQCTECRGGAHGVICTRRFARAAPVEVVLRGLRKQSRPN